MMNRKNLKGGKRIYKNVDYRMKGSNYNNKSNESSITKGHSSCDGSDSSCTVENQTHDVSKGSEITHTCERDLRFPTKDNKVSYEDTLLSTRSLKPTSVVNKLGSYCSEQKFRSIDAVIEQDNKNDHESTTTEKLSCYDDFRNSNGMFRDIDAVSEEKVDKSKKIFSVDHSNDIRTDRSSVANKELLTKVIEPNAVISNLMSEITGLANLYLDNHVKEIGNVSLQIGEANGKKIILEVLGNRKTNMISQMKCFSDFFQHSLHDLAELYGESDKTVLKKTEEIFSQVKRECKLFSKKLPAYSLKQELKTALTSYQVIVISCDVAYCSNIVIPLVVQNLFEYGLIASCEVHEIVALTSAQNCSSIVDQNPGQLVGYDIGQASIRSKCTKILYITVQELLSYSLRDPLFSRYSCIVLNEFLHRSIEVDILLVSLRECLAQRKDLRLIVIVASEHSAVNLKSYFSRKVKASLINTEKLTSPAQVIWKGEFCSPDDDIITEAVNICFAVHALKLNEEGDVLIFLPSEKDALKAAKLTEKKLHEHSFNDVLCISINEKSKFKKLLQALKPQQKSKRAIIFVTDGFEVVAFPSVRYVIDCGRRNEICYDSEKKIEVHKMSFISRSRCRIRKNCIGRYDSGICFRLYSHENYKNNMIPSELPEVFNRSPLNSVVRVFQYRHDSSLTTQFVEPFSEQVKESALKALQSLGALKDGKLTQLGEHIIKLPFLPEHSKLIILGKQKSFPFEVIVLVSFFLVKGNAFKYNSTEEIQKKIDAAKLHFIQNNSDTLTFLNVYRQWAENEYSESWCIDNYIEFNFLDCVHAKVREVCEIINKNLDEIVLDEFSDDYRANSDMWLALQELIFECFRDNLCVYTGHCLSGYRSLTAHCIAFLHPSTCITRKENLPQFIVYDKFISETRNFVTRITTIPDTCVTDAFNNKLLQVGRNVLFQQKLVPHVIDPVGLTIIKRALTKEKLRELEEQIKEETESELIVIEPSEEKGNVTLYAFPDSINKAVEIMKKFLDENTEKFWDEEETLILELQKGNSTVPIHVTWSKGAKISSVVTGFYQNPNDNLQSSSLGSNSISHTETTTVHSCVLLTWLRRLCTGNGFVKFQNCEDFSKARRLSMRTIKVKGACAEVEVDLKEEYQLSVSGLDPETTDEDLKKAVEKNLEGVSVGYAKVGYSSPFETSDDIEAVEMSLRWQLQNIFGRHEVEVVKIHKPETSVETTMSAEVQPFMVANIYNLEQLAEFLNNALKVNDVSVKAKTWHYSDLFCSVEIWNKLEPHIFNVHQMFEQELEEINQSCNLEVKTFDFQTQRLKISSEKEENMTKLRKIVQDLLEGYVISSAGINCLPKLFCHGGYVWLRALEKSADIYVIDDYKSKTIRLYGSKEACKTAELQIIDFLSSVEEETVMTIDLDYGKDNRTLLRAIIKKYDVELREFIDECELRSAELDIRKCELTLHGSVDSIDKATNLLEELEKQCDSDCVQKMHSDQETCSLCFSPPALTRTFRLENCGHLYCGDCIQPVVNSPTIPLQCFHENCQKDIIVEDIRRVLDHDTEKIKKFLWKSLKHYINENENFAYCPAPDCTMFVDKEIFPNAKWNCSLCHNDICLTCKVIYHHGYDCDMYQGMQKDSDHQFKVYRKDHPNCKFCPKCKAAIEKTAGCNHMQCCNCSTHFCWRCVTAFATGKEVYNHQSSCRVPP